MFRPALLRHCRAVQSPSVYECARHISMGDLGPLKKLFSNPQLISAGMELAKNDGKSLPDKMVALMKTNPELAKTIMEAFKDPEVKSALDKVMQDEQVKKKVMPVVDQFVKEVVGK